MILDRPFQRRVASIVPALALCCWSYACGDEETSGGDIPTGSTASSSSSSGYFGSEGGAGQGGAASSASASGSGGSDEGGAGGMMGVGGGSSTLSCADIQEMYMKLTGPMKQACSATTTCTLVKGHCMMGLGDACWYALDGTVPQDKLDKAAAEWNQHGCQGTICNSCGPMPSDAACNEGMCEVVP